MRIAARLPRLALLLVFAIAVALPGKLAAEPSAVQIMLNQLGNSGQWGFATLEAMGDKTKVTLYIMGVAGGANQPAHIHEGTCAAPNPAPAFPLPNVMGPMTEGVVDAPLSKLLSQPYLINVHKSPQDLPTYQTCGDIAPGMAMTPGGASVWVQVNAVGGSGQMGWATFTAWGDKTKVTLSLTGVPAGANQPAHLHEGTCASPNPAPAFPLTNVTGGWTESVVDAPLSALMSKPYLINIHKSAAEISVYITCGNVGW